jgi:uncharacterized protein YbjT (DUF2867 family)
LARILIVGGGARGVRLTQRLIGEGHAVRITTRSEERREEIEAAGAECWIGTPDRLATLRAALENVTVACWMLGAAHGSEEQLASLHTSRLEFFINQIIDTTVRGFIYEPPGGGASAEISDAALDIACRVTSRNSIPLLLLKASPEETEQWLSEAHAAISSVLS